MEPLCTNSAARELRRSRPRNLNAPDHDHSDLGDAQFGFMSESRTPGAATIAYPDGTQSYSRPSVSSAQLLESCAVHIHIDLDIDECAVVPGRAAAEPCPGSVGAPTQGAVTRPDMIRVPPNRETSDDGS